MKKNRIVKSSENLWRAWAKERIAAGNMTDLIVPDYITEINDLEFADCETLESVTFHSNIKSIGKEAFKNCRSLRSVVVPDGAVLGDESFSGCTGLTHVILSGESFANFVSAFSGCSDICSVTFSSGNVVFDGDEESLGQFEKLATVKFLRQVTGFDPMFFPSLKNLKSIRVSPNNASFESACDNQAIVDRKTGDTLFSCGL